MTEPGGVLVDRAQLERAFTALGERLVRRGVVADVFVVGGAAMALAYDATRSAAILRELAYCTILGLPVGHLIYARQRFGRPARPPTVRGRDPLPRCRLQSTAGPANRTDEGRCRTRHRYGCVASCPSTA